MLFLQYLCKQNQMKTVKTLHFDFLFVGVFCVFVCTHIRMYKRVVIER